MNNYILFFLHNNKDWGFKKTWIGKWCWMYNLTPIIIDTSGERKTKETPPFWFHSLQDVLKHDEFKDKKYIWFDHHAEKYVDEFDHPAEDSIYCFGEDLNGFGDFDIWKHEGEKLKVRPTNDKIEPNQPFHVAITVPIVVHDRFLYLMGKRK